MNALVTTNRNVSRVVTGAACCAVVIGALIAVRPAYGVAALAALCFIPLVAGSVPLGIAVWLPAMFVVLGLATTALQFLIVAAWLGCLIARPATVRELLPGQRTLLAALGLLLAWLSLSVLWAREVSPAWHELVLWLVAGGVLVVVATVTGRTGCVRLVMAAFVAGALLSVIVGLLGFGPAETVVPGSLLSQSVAHRFSGAEGNPNELATQLIVAIVFAGVLAADARRRELRLGLAAVALGLTVALAATESRGGLVAFAVALVIAPLLFWRQRMPAVAAIGLVAIAAAGFFAASPGARDRVTEVNDGGAGRSTLWAVAWRMAKDNAPEGVGLDNFRAVSPDYLRTPGSLRYAIQIDDPHVVHNEYLELLAETGIVGLLLLLALVGICLGAARRAARAFEALGRHDLARISRAVLLAGIGVLVAQVFASSAYDARLWALFALGPALLAMATRVSWAVPR